MRTRTLVPTLALVVAIACGSAACGGEAAVDPASVTWTDQVCGALAGFTGAVTDQPRIDQADPVAAVQSATGYVGTTTEALQRSISALDAVGPSPVSGGDEYVTRLKDALTRIKAGFDAARSQLGGVDTSSPQAFAAAFPAAMAPLQELRNLPDPTEGLRANDELRAASEQAPRCREIRSIGTPTG